jgi:polyphosphate kinase 2 (PPK2 family)
LPIKSRIEDYADRQGTKILKFFLHVSREEQKKRFIDRLDEPEKKLEVLGLRHRGAQVLGRLHARLRGSD